MKARKKPIEVMAIHYNHNIILDEFLDLLKTNKDEPVRYDETDKTIYIQKERGEIALFLKKTLINVFGLLTMRFS